jgi:ElaB/YqjD/DUF883 family membrane-anchored ribosome-binding protein
MSDAGTRPAEDATGNGVPDISGPTDVDSLKAEIEATREQLGQTVDELSSRLDVPARARESAARAKDTAVETYRESPPLVIGGALALVGVVVGLVVWRKKRATRRRKR